MFVIVVRYWSPVQLIINQTTRTEQICECSRLEWRAEQAVQVRGTMTMSR